MGLVRKGGNSGWRCPAEAGRPLEGPAPGVQCLLLSPKVALGHAQVEITPFHDLFFPLKQLKVMVRKWHHLCVEGKKTCVCEILRCFSDNLIWISKMLLWPLGSLTVIMLWREIKCFIKPITTM